MKAGCISAALITLGVCGCAAQPTQLAPTLAAEPATQSALASATRPSPQEYAVVDVNTRAAGDAEIICEREAKLGSHFKREVCRTRTAVEQARSDSQEWLRTGGFSGSPTVVR